MPEMTKPILDVVAGILWENGRYLAVERPPGSVQAGFWEFPGGKIEPGETPGEALARELAEELDVTPLDALLWRKVEHVYDHAVVRLSFFLIRAFEGRPTPLDGQRLAWVAPGEPCSLPFLPADTAIVAALADLDPDHPGE